MDVPQMALAQEVEVLIPTLASLPMAVMITDCNGVVQFVNPPLEALAGYAADNLIGQPAGLVVSGTSIQENIQTVAASGQPWKGESLCRQKSGHVVPVEITISPIRGTTGAATHFLVTARDVPESRPVEVALQAEARVHQAVFSLLGFAGDHSLGELLQQTLDEVCGLTHSKVGFYHFVSENQQTLSLQAWSTATLRDYCKAEGRGLHYDLAMAGVWADCVRERRAIIHNDYESLPNRRGLPPGHAEVVRELVVPVFKRDRIVAILGVGNKATEYDQRDMETVTRFAELVWVITENKRAEDALRASQDHFRSLFESMNEGVACCKMFFDGDEPQDWVYEEVNAAFEQLTGLRDVAGKKVSEVIPGIRDSNPELFAIFGRAALTGKAERFETYVEPLGSWFSISAYSPQAEHFVAVFDNITERKQAEDRLRESEEWYRTLLHTAMDGFWVTDMPGRLLQVNEAYCWMSGYSAEELLAMRIPDLETIETATDAAAHIQRVMAQGEDRFQSQHRRKDGSVFDVEVSVQYLPGDGGRLVCFLRDITESKRSENALQHANEALSQAERHYRRLFNSGSDGVFVFGFDDDGSPSLFLDVNDSACRLLGYTREELLRKRIFDISPAERHPELPTFVTRLRAEHGLIWEGAALTKDGHHVPVEINTRVFDLESSPTVISCVRDITERKRAQEALEQSHDLLSNLARLVPGVVYQYRLYPDGRSAFPYSSPGMNDIYERTPEEVREDATPVFGRLHPDDYDRVAESIQESARTLQTFYCEFRVILPRQGLRWRWSQAQPERMEDGGTLWHGIISDITEQKLAEGRLRESEGRLRRAVLHAPFPIMLHAEDGEVLMISDAWTEISGYSHADIPTTQHWTERAYGQRKDLVQEDINRLYGLTGKVAEGEYEVQTKCGKKRTWEFASASLGSLPDGRRLAMSMAMDVTEQKLLEASLVQAQKMESVGRLAGGVAHDFNNLLTVINGYSGFLLGRLKPDSPLRPYAEEISKAGARAASLTKQLLAFSRKQVIEPQALDLNTTIRDAVPMLQRLIGEDIQLTPHLDGLLGQVMADPDQIYQVIMNLAVNARDAMPDGGKIDIETANVELDDASAAAIDPDATPGRYIRIAVTDTGHGMDEATRQHVFEPFFTTKEAGKGTGLGLSTVYGIMRQSDGWVIVSSQVDVGTSFKIYFPRIDACPLPEAKRSSAPAKSGETVLLVEDQDAVRSFTKAVLTEYGYHTLEAPNGEEAIAIAKGYPGQIHLLLTDVVLTGMNGKVLSERLRELRPNLRTVFISGYTANVIAKRGVLDHGAAFLQKPFSPDELAVKVREVLGDAEVGVVTVLLAEDSKIVRKLLAEIMCEGGYAVVEVCDGLQALERLREQPVQVVLMDMNMPRLSGLAAAKEMRKQHSQVKIILMSAAFEDGFHVNLKELGVDAVLPKPVSPETLLGTLRQVTGFVKAIPK